MAIQRARIGFVAVLTTASLAFTSPAFAALHVNLTGIGCNQQQESGSDEIYIGVNGSRINIGWFQNGTGIATNIISNASPTRFDLWEDDGNHWYDGDDYFGTIEISTPLSGWPNSQYHELFADCSWGVCVNYVLSIRACTIGPGCPT
jgi:hypothetical protein